MHAFVNALPVQTSVQVRTIRTTPKRTEGRHRQRRSCTALLFGGRKKAPAIPDFASEVAEAERKYGPRGNAALAPEIDAANAAYNHIRGRLMADTAFLSAVWICLAWSLGSVIDAKSAICGCVAGLGYTTLLSPDVGELARSGSVLDAGKSNQPLRYLLLPFLVLVTAKSHGNLHVLPAIAGFFSYKVALIVPLITGQAFVEE